MNKTVLSGRVCDGDVDTVGFAACPFCGGEANLRITKHIPRGLEYTPQCSDASCAGRLTKKWLEKDVAVYAWNRRASDENA